MSRAVLALDRVVALLLGLSLLLAAAALILWWRADWRLTGTLRTRAVLDHTTDSWWPWAIGAAGILLLVVGLRWLLAHIPRRGVSFVRLPGSGPSGRLTAQVSPVARAAAQVFEQIDGVRSARATVIRERGQLVARLRANIEPHAPLTHLAAEADAVAAQLREVLHRDDLHCRIDLRTTRTKRAIARVR